ncbi:J domain-containing protein [Flammeovirga kamogawensis]|uniref:DnaJ domain-containing protein n=1 Tax=Flammeovirga kamogawensis TaxID=373891 RepID=A0ABX8GZI1_9BACT|nr:DnaJ domain-containing protein [Flammeovirga kamogawensis]MBB6458936.1 curved DNA-binding protein CbpA [Flammeovirga kamogawensis]QWG08512.1 DnaJ domain-containing protein [Flammeovirga kamogawensis]TRX66805.1 J domain-containing protein [Flammeovirga kamogawensis]
MFSYYEILEINTTATPSEIKKAYKVMAKKYHPDKNKNNLKSEEYFKLISTAYQNLSDPYQRLMYDEWLKYTRLEEEQEEENFKKKSEALINYKPAYSQADKEKEDKEVIMWGLGTTAVLIGVVFLFIVTHNYFENKEEQRRISSEKQEINKVLYLSDNGNYGKALIKADSLHYKLTYFSDRSNEIYDSLLSEIEEYSLFLFEEGEYEKVIQVVGDVQHELKEKTPVEMLWQLAIAQFNKGNYKGAEVTFNYLIQKNKYDLSIYPAFSEVYASGFNDSERAIEVLTKGVDVTVEYYKDFYGDAYALVLEGNEIPYTHLAIYFLRARLHMERGEYEHVIRDCKWSLRLKPNDPKLNYLLGLAFKGKGENNAACVAMRKATNLGHLQATNWLSENCQ